MGIKAADTFSLKLNPCLSLFRIRLHQLKVREDFSFAAGLQN
jgi:hypothetical protein